MKSRTLPARLAGPISGLCGAIAIVLSILWLSSDLWYTTAGVDFEEPRDGQVALRDVRLRWGARCFWVGYAEKLHPAREAPRDRWDPGGACSSLPSFPSLGA